MDQVREILKKMESVQMQTDNRCVVAVHTESGVIAPLQLREVQDKLGVTYDEFVGIIKGMLMRINTPESGELSIKECFGVILELADLLDFEGLCVAVHGLEMGDEIPMPTKKQPVLETVMDEDSESESDDEDWWI